MKILFLLLSCLTCYAQFPYSGTTWKGPYASAITPSFLDSLPNIEHHWAFTDLVTNTAVGVSSWVDRIQATTFYLDLSGPTRPTNSSLGLVFSGNQSLTNNQKNITGTLSAMSYNDQVNNRFFCLIYSTTNKLNENLQNFFGGVGGLVLNANGGTGNSAGRASLTSDSSFSSQLTLAPTGTLNTNGVVQCFCWGNTNHPVGNFGAEGYANGAISGGFAPTAGFAGRAMHVIGNGFNLAQINYLNVLTFTNCDFALTQSNVNYFRTNFYH